MASINPRNVGESLYWSYANLAMAFASGIHDEPEYKQTDYIVRNKVYYGLLRRKLKLGSFLKDEKFKISYSDACCYCFSEEVLSLDHLIPQFKGGKHSADNLVIACRSCNSSKKSLDFLEWTAKRGEWPCLWLLRRYLKLAICYCVENDLMGIRLENCKGAPTKDIPRIFETDLKEIKLEPAEVASSKQASLFDELEMNSHLESCEKAGAALPFAIALIPLYIPEPG